MKTFEEKENDLVCEIQRIKHTLCQASDSATALGYHGIADALTGKMKEIDCLEKLVVDDVNECRKIRKEIAI
jgi:hypothetical protein